MLFFKHLSLSATLFSIVILGSPAILPRDPEPLNISNPPTRGAACPTETIPASEITAALTQGHAWVQEAGHHTTYPRLFRNLEGLSFSDCEGVTMYEYPILLGGRQNPWVPATPKTKVPGKSEVRVIFASTSATEAVFCGVVAKDENKDFQICPI